jgi:small conductance mechanosensitive channel
MENLNALLLELQKWGAEFGLKILAAIVVIFVGLRVAHWARRTAERLMSRANLDTTLTRFTGNAVYIALVTLITIIALGQLGVQTASFVAIVGSAGLAVGLALQGSLSNLAAGVLMIIFRPFRVGDYILGAGTEGIVEEIQLFVTILNSLDNQVIIVPNGVLASGNITNLSGKPERRVDLVIAVSYKENLARVKQIIQEVLDQEPLVLKHPEATIGVLELASIGVNLAVRPWVKTEDYWTVYFNLHEAIKNRFDEEDIQIPFLQRDVYLSQN